MKSDRHIILYTLLKKYKDEVELLTDKLKNTNEVACAISQLHPHEEHFYNAANLRLIKEKYKAIAGHFLEYNCALCYIRSFFNNSFFGVSSFQEAYFILITNENIDNDILKYLKLEFYLGAFNYKIISVDNKMPEYWK